MNFNAYGYGPPDARQWIVVDCGVLFGRESRHAGRRHHHARHPLPGGAARRCAGHRRSPTRMRTISAPSRMLWPHAECPIYATPFTARLIARQAGRGGLRDAAQGEGRAARRHAHAGAVRVDFISITHSIPEPNRRSPSARPWAWSCIPATGSSIPIPCIGEATDDAALRKLGDEGVLALVCDSTNALVPGHSGSEADVRKACTELIGTLKGRVAVTAFASNVARLESIAEAARAHGREIVAGRPLHAPDGRGRARHRLSERLSVHHRRRRVVAPAAAQRALSCAPAARASRARALARIAGGRASRCAVSARATR